MNICNYQCWKEKDNLYVGIPILHFGSICHYLSLSVILLNRNVLYHRFPKNENIFALWVQRCKRTDKWNPQNSRVCFEHFTPDDYERDLKSELLSLPEKKHLKASAIPSLLLPATFGKPNSTVLEQNNQQKRLEIRRRKELVQNLLQNEVISYVPEEENRTQFKEVATETEADDSEAKYNKLQKKYDDLVFSYSDLKRSTSETITQLRLQIKSLKKNKNKTKRPKTTRKLGTRRPRMKED
ncbi:hypothetical protein ABEB36_001842 [Hypothenemus hampei]|uniref:THAP-type domain-containing protein n=1 Tax=Hypothenemus hampei TaxID=57062 RepID=A0ABD1FGY0_HYPHA